MAELADAKDAVTAEEKALYAKYKEADTSDNDQVNSTELKTAVSTAKTALETAMKAANSNDTVTFDDEDPAVGNAQIALYRAQAQAEIDEAQDDIDAYNAALAKLPTLKADIEALVAATAAAEAKEGVFADALVDAKAAILSAEGKNSTIGSGNLKFLDNTNADKLASIDGSDKILAGVVAVHVNNENGLEIAVRDGDKFVAGADAEGLVDIDVLLDALNALLTAEDEFVDATEAKLDSDKIDEAGKKYKAEYDAAKLTEDELKALGIDQGDKTPDAIFDFMHDDTTGLAVVKEEAEEVLVELNKAIETWQDLATSCRKEVRQALIDMQRVPSLRGSDSEYGALCAYCESLIHVNSGHIEHFRRKNPRYFPELTFEWSNLFFSCSSHKHCGHYKDRKNALPYNPDELIKPDEESFEKYLYFHSTGEVRIRPNLTEEEQRKAANTINVFNLKDPALIYARREVLKAYQKAIIEDLEEIMSWSEEDRNEYLQGEINETCWNSHATTIKHFLSNTLFGEH